MCASILLALAVAGGLAAGPAPAEVGPAPARAAPAWAAPGCAAPAPDAPAAVRAPLREIERQDRRRERMRRDVQAPARRIVRKREALPSETARRAIERADPSVPALADQLQATTAALHRASRRAPVATSHTLRLLAAGAPAARLHLPPPTSLL